MSERSNATVFVADDFPAIRRGIKQILDELDDLVVVGEAGTGVETLAGVSESSPDVVLLDLGMPDVHGYDLVRELVRRYPRAAVLVFTMREVEEVGVGCLRAGAQGFLAKTAGPHEIVEALRTVASGQRYMPPELVELLVRGVPTEPEEAPHQALSDREREVLERIVRGQKASQIAKALGISAKTVQTYRARIMDKLSVKTTVDLVLYAVDHGLVPQRAAS